MPTCKLRAEILVAPWHIQQHVTGKMCDVLLESADRSQEAFISLKDNYKSIVGRRQALRDECSQLASEKKRLLQFVQVLNEKLEHFEGAEIF